MGDINLEYWSEVCQRIHAILNQDSLLILHRNKWRCLERSYSLVLDALVRRVQHASSILGSLELSLKLTGPLEALYHVMQEGERCIEDCTRRSTDDHTWLVDKVLRMGMSTDVVDIHLHDLVWCYSVLEQALRGVHLDGMDLLQEMRMLCEIWAGEGAGDDLGATREMLARIKAKRKGETSRLADFILHKLSNASDLEGVASDVLPEYLWVAQEELVRNPDPIGAGGYAKVYETGWLGGHFAVKDFFYVEDNIQFGREAVIQARLRHPNVMHLVCCTKNPKRNKCSLVMELMPKDLRGLMNTRMKDGLVPPFPDLLTAVQLMLQIAKGMEYLHSLHIIHRDLKSSNILVSFPTGDLHAHLKVADFGMSKAKDASSKYTSKQIGTTSWRAPEVFEIKPEDEMKGDRRYTKKADVYSFGLVCFEILTGKIPFEGSEVYKRVMGGERPKLPSDCPLALANYIEKCWHGEELVRPSFTQICRMLRYFKACILLENHHDPSAAQWLSRSLSSSMCDRIEYMLKSFEPSLENPGVLLHPGPLRIPLEMYCCRLVLEEGDRAESSSSHGYEKHESTCEPAKEISFTTIANSSSNTFLATTAENVLKNSEPGFFWRIFSKFLQVQRKQQDKSEMGRARNFTYQELNLATGSFCKVIGQGSFAKVYFGKLVDRQEIAVKRGKCREPADDYADDDDDDVFIARELRIVSQLRHPNIVPLLGWCQTRRELLLVYEFMPNGDLSSHIFGNHEGRVSVIGWEQRNKVLFQLASALKYLHDVQIVHRDVKPCNVFLDVEWNARLGDCGSALLLKDDRNIGYLAPETFYINKVSPASDVYSFGITVLEAACGRKVIDLSREAVHVRNWVWALYHAEEVMEASDVRLGGGFNEAEMRRWLLLGLSCTNQHPETRPTMEEVLQILSGASELPPPKGSEVLSSEMFLSPR